MAQTFGPNIVARLLCEAVGTFALLYVGVMVLTAGGGPGLTGVALAHGLTIAVMASATMTISGGHLNPAVTLGIWVGKKISTPDAIAYVATQLAAGFLGATLARLSLGGDDIGGGIPAPAGDVGVGTAILVEAILTFFLMFVIYGTGVDPRFNGRVGGLAIGLAVTLDILAGGPITGAAMNPARWFGAALADGTMDNAVIYLVGPVAGALLAAFVYSRFILEKPTMHPPAEPVPPRAEAR